MISPVIYSRKIASPYALLLSPLLFAIPSFAQQVAQSDWPSMGATPGNSHYSTLSQINRTNVSTLKESWRFDTGESGGLETTPTVIDGILYGLTPSKKVFALNAATGKSLWKFDSGIKAGAPSRGVSWWTNGKERRLLVGIGSFLYALDPATGKPISSFGSNGRVDLREDLGRDPESLSVSLNTPGVIYKNLIIVGSSLPETIPSPPGDIRAYDVRTGKLTWSFHTIPHPREPGYETWSPDSWKTSGAANNWCGMAIDLERGIVYVPTGSAVPDFYGAGRLGDNLYANTLLALDAATGKLIWHFQGIHHDIWDRDFPSPPLLLNVRRNGKTIPAVVQTTKQGILYVFDRTNGKPIFPIEERPALPSDVPGEVAAKTQPHPLGPGPFAPQTVTEASLTNRTPAAHAWAVERLKELRNDGLYVPLSVGKDTLITPSFEGGGEWGGPASDPQTGVIYINANMHASIATLISSASDLPGRATYLAQCSVCHGDHRQGDPPSFPSLNGIGKKLSTAEIASTIHSGKGRMPSFALAGRQLNDLLAYLETPSDAALEKAASEQQAPPEQGSPTTATRSKPAQYTMTGYRRFNDPDGYPATATPWGSLNALDLSTGKYLWKLPLGEYPELAAKDTGSENYGGPTVTAGGLIFIAATNFDHKIRAFDKATGKMLWQFTLPFAGNATPVTYIAGGKQYVVIAAGGTNLNPRGPTGGVYVAFSVR